MVEQLRVACPRCKTKLKLKSRQSLGKKATCPKCKHSFVLTVKKGPADAVEEVDEFDSFEDASDSYDDDYGASALPRRRSKAEAARAAKKKEQQKKRSWVLPTSIAAAGVLIVVVGAAFLAKFFLGESGETPVAVVEEQNRVDLAYLSADTEVLITIRLSEIWEAEILNPLVTQPQVRQAVDELVQKTGLQPQDVESVTIGIAGVSEAAKAAGAAMQQNLQAGEAPNGVPPGAGMPGANPMGMPGGMPAGMGMAGLPGLQSVRTVVVVRTSKAVDEQKLVALANGAEAVNHGKSTYYRLPAAATMGQTGAFYVADTGTIVLGDEASVKSAIETGGQAERRVEFDFVDPEHQILIAAVPRDRSLFSQGSQLAPNAPQPAAGEAPGLQHTFGNVVEAVSLGLDFAKRIDVQIRCDCIDAEKSRQLKSTMAAAVNESRENLRQMAKSLPPQVANLTALAGAVLDSVRFTESESVVELTASVPASAKTTLKNLPETMMALMMYNAMQSMTDAGPGQPSGEPMDVGDFAFENQNERRPPQNDEPADGDVTVLRVEPESAELLEAETAQAGRQPGIEPEAGDPSSPTVDLAALESEWTSDLNVQNEPAVDVLTRIGNELGIAVRHSRGAAQRSRKPVTVSLSGVSRLQAIEEVCRQVGLHPKYANDAVELEVGERDLPVVFSGPFLIEVAGVEEFAPDPTGILQLKVVGAGLNASTLAALRVAAKDAVVVERVVGSDGSDLLDTKPVWSVPSSTAMFEYTAPVPLKHLLSGVTAIQSVAGYISLPVATDVKTLRFDRLNVGERMQQENVELRLVDAQLAGRTYVLRFEVNGVEDHDIELVAYDGGGKRLNNMAYGGSSGHGRGTLNLTLQERPASVVATIVGSRQQLRYDFQLAHVPLESHARMPDQLESLSFAGQEAPAIVKFLRMTGQGASRKARFAAVNHSNKNILEMDLNCTYLDATGNRISDQAITHQGAYNKRTGRQGVLAAKQGRDEFEVTSLTPPSGAQNMSASVKRVRFADATEWTADSQ